MFYLSDPWHAKVFPINNWVGWPHCVNIAYMSAPHDLRATAISLTCPTTSWLWLDWWQLYEQPVSVDSFTDLLHSHNGRHLAAVSAVQRDCHWGLKKGGNSHWSHESIMQWGTRQSQSIFRPTNHKSQWEAMSHSAPLTVTVLLPPG